MTKEEALKMLENAPRSTVIKSKLNPILTQAQAVDIVEKGIMAYKGNMLDYLFEKRVRQVTENKKHPRCQVYP